MICKWVVSVMSLKCKDCVVNGRWLTNFKMKKGHSGWKLEKMLLFVVASGLVWFLIEGFNVGKYHVYELVSSFLESNQVCCKIFLVFTV